MKSEIAALNPTTPPLLSIFLNLTWNRVSLQRWVGDSRILILLIKNNIFLKLIFNPPFRPVFETKKGKLSTYFKFTPPQHTTRILSLCVQRCWCPHCLCGDDPAVSKLHKVCRERFIYPPPSTLPGCAFSLFCDHSISSINIAQFTTLAEQLWLIVVGNWQIFR